MTRDEEREIMDRIQKISTRTIVYLVTIAFALSGWAVKMQVDVGAVDKRLTDVMIAHEGKDGQVYLRMDQKIENLAQRNDRTDRLLEDISKRLDEIYKLMMSKHIQ